MKIYAVGSVPMQISGADFYQSEAKAIAAIARIADERRYRPGVYVLTDTPTEFSYTIGWEESRVTFAIKEIQVRD